MSASALHFGVRPAENSASIAGREPSSTNVACAHCTLPVPAVLLDPNSDRDHQFCCHGCQTVYAVLHGCGLAQFYGLRAADGIPAVSARTTGRAFDEFDDPVFTSLYVQSTPDALNTVELVLEGVDCAACIWLLEKLPNVVKGVIEARLDLSHSLLRVTWDPRTVALSQIARSIDSLGYPPHPARDTATRTVRRAEDRKLLVRIAVAGACSGNVMLLAFALYAGLFAGMEDSFRHYFRYWSMALGVLSLAWPGSIFFRGAYAAIRTRSAHLDLPIAIALAAGGLAGIANTIFDAGEIYFDSLTMLVFLLLVGRWIQRRQQRRATDAVELLYALTPSVARRIERAIDFPNRERERAASSADAATEIIREVPIEALRPVDLVEVRAGDTIPVDGVIESGVSTIDQSLLTGESRPTDVRPGEMICAGTTNLSSTLRIRATAAGQQTRIGKLMQLIERGARQQAPIVHQADRIAARFTLVVLVISLITFAIWLRVSPHAAIDSAASLLIVTCPCALALATPLIIAVATGRAARRGMLVKSGDALEALAKSGTILLDKTGTLTQGRVKLETWYGDASVQPLVAALESHSNHPIARAFTDAFSICGTGFQPVLCGTRFQPVLPRAHITQTLGGGIEGTVSGHSLIIGSPTFVRERVREFLKRDRKRALAAYLAKLFRTRDVALDARTPSSSPHRDNGAPSSTSFLDPSIPGSLDPYSLNPSLPDHEQSILASGQTPVLIARDHRIVAIAGFGDPIRDDAADAIREARKLGWKIKIVSGDHPLVASAVGQRLGIHTLDVHGGATPEYKLAAVHEAAKHGAVIMVGDGVNDAAAISAATVGIAVHGGAEASLAAADVYLREPGLTPIVDLIHLGRHILWTIRACFIVSLAYNLIGGTLAVLGFIHPLIAAIMMPLSSLSVTAMALAPCRVGTAHRFRSDGDSPRAVREAPPAERSA